MLILFSFCDCHWILPWILPFILGLFFGSRMISSYKNRIRDLESNQLRESKRFAALEADASQYKAQLEESLQAQTNSNLSDNEKLSYEQEIATLNKKLNESNSKIASGIANSDVDTEAKHVEIDALHSKIADLEQELLIEKAKSEELAQSVAAPNDVVGESARSHSDMAELRQQLLSTQSELSLAKGKLQEQVDMHAKLDNSKENEQLRRRITELEADLALAKGKEYEENEAGLEDSTITNLRKRLLETEGELALLKGKEYESEELDNTESTYSDLRKQLLETEAELALAKGKEYEAEEGQYKTSDEVLKQRILSLEAELALIKGKSYETAEQNKIASSAIIVQQGGARIKKKSGKKSATKQNKKTSKKIKGEKKKEKSKVKASKKTEKGKKVKTKPSSSKLGKSGKAPKVKPKSISSAAAKKNKVTSGFKPAKEGKFSKIKEGDLTAIEGIGPKAAALLKKKGIKSWADLAAKSPGQLKELLSSQKGFAHVDPSTWTRQAKLAAGNHWTRLAKLQDDLDGGKVVKKTKKTKSKTKSKASTSKSSTKKLNIKLNNKLKSDNFELIEGIGPKMNSLLLKEGIKSWSDLASFSPGELRGILDKHGDKYKIIDVKTWSKQASFASKGHWTKLIDFQKNDGSDSKAEKVLTKMGIIKPIDTSDLKIVEGIGPKIESLLKKAGVETLADLAKASKTKLKKILENAGARYGLADPTHWAKQAALANAGKHAELKKLQDRI